MNEYVLSTDEFNKPKVFKDRDAIFLRIVRLFLLEPGTYQTNPDMGLGLVSKYRYGYKEDVESLESEAMSQISEYLPDLVGVTVNISTDNTNNLLTIKVTIDNTMYEFSFNTTTLQLSSL